jgi:hypothetical protein
VDFVVVLFGMPGSVSFAFAHQMGVGLGDGVMVGFAHNAKSLLGQEGNNTLETSLI